jgi:hypothetical protein
MLLRVALVRTDVSEEHSISFIRLTRIGELAIASVVPSSPILVTLMKEALFLRNVGSYKSHTA